VIPFGAGATAAGAHIIGAQHGFVGPHAAPSCTHPASAGGPVSGLVQLPCVSHPFAVTESQLLQPAMQPPDAQVPAEQTATS
jgi:hypothetical protein